MSHNRVLVALVGVVLLFIGVAMLANRGRLGAMLRMRERSLLTPPIWWTTVAGPLAAIALGLIALVLAIVRS